MILNEALANEPGSATTLEWVEVYNRAALDAEPIGLNGYRFVDGGDTTLFDDSVVIPSGGFAVLARKPVGPSSFESYWGNNSGVWGDAASEDFPLVVASMSLRNDADTVTLIAPSGDTSSIYWAVDTGDGTSIERIRPDAGDIPKNFAPCVDNEHRTPGHTNSVTPRPNFLKITGVVYPQSPDWGNDMDFAVVVENTGLGRSSLATVTMLRDITPSTPQFDGESSASSFASPLEEGEQETVHVVWRRPLPGQYSIEFAVSFDTDTTDRTPLDHFTVRHTQPLVIITEYLANPDDGPGEWVEICNQADFAVGMNGTRLGDAGSSGALVGDVGTISPGTYWVLVQDESAFRAYYPSFSGVSVQIGGWPTLNNAGDVIRLIGAGGELIDSVRYSVVYDNNRSVERLTLSPTFAAANDWTVSVDPSGATPGRANSVNRELAGTFQVSVSPNPIYLSRANVASIEYRMEIGERLTIKLFDRSGQLVKTIADETPSATGTITWDGTGDDGAAVRPGAYVLLARSDPRGDVVKKVIVVGP